MVELVKRKKRSPSSVRPLLWSMMDLVILAHSNNPIRITFRIHRITLEHFKLNLVLRMFNLFRMMDLETLVPLSSLLPTMILAISRPPRMTAMEHLRILSKTMVSVPLILLPPLVTLSDPNLKLPRCNKIPLELFNSQPLKPWEISSRMMDLALSMNPSRKPLVALSPQKQKYLNLMDLEHLIKIHQLQMMILEILRNLSKKLR